MTRPTKRVSSREQHRRLAPAAAAQLLTFHDPLILTMAVAALVTRATMAALGSYSDEMLRRARRGQIPKPTKDERAARRRGELSPDRAREIAAYDHVVFTRRAAKTGPGQTVRSANALVTEQRPLRHRPPASSSRRR